MEVFCSSVLLPRLRSVKFRYASSGANSLAFCILTVVFVGTFKVDSIVYIFDTLTGTLPTRYTLVVSEESIFGS